MKIHREPQGRCPSLVWVAPLALGIPSVWYLSAQLQMGHGAIAADTAKEGFSVPKLSGSTTGNERGSNAVSVTNPNDDGLP